MNTGDQFTIYVTPGNLSDECIEWVMTVQNMYGAYFKSLGRSVVASSIGLIVISGNAPDGFAASETGTHRRVRESPFDPVRRRYTSFAYVSVNESSTGPLKWRGAIRSYIQHPYELVKDNRTEYEVSDATASVLSGERIGEFIEAHKNLFTVLS